MLEFYSIIVMHLRYPNFRARSSFALQEDKSLAEGQIVSSQTITSKSRTVETTTYAIEQGGGTETHIEQKVRVDVLFIDHQWSIFK
jgi:hypothetical protein